MAVKRRFAGKRKKQIKPVEKVQKLVLVDPKTGERLLTFDRDQNGFRELRRFVLDYLKDRYKYTKSMMTQPMIFLSVGTQQDLKEGGCKYTFQALQRYGMEFVPIEQIESESIRRGWITKECVNEFESVSE